ncbi:N-acetyltransferase [Oscillospiraceae bacterium PP1C4]
MIRSFIAEDTGRIMQIWMDASLKSHDFIPADYWREQYGIVKSKYLPASQTLVFEQDGNIAGFISILDGSYIGGLFVDPALQQQGIGTALIDCCKVNHTTLSLAVYRENVQACNFYRKCGFIEQEEQVSEYPPHTEFLMKWNKED